MDAECPAGQACLNQQCLPPGSMNASAGTDTSSTSASAGTGNASSGGTQTSGNGGVSGVTFNVVTSGATVGTLTAASTGAATNGATTTGSASCDPSALILVQRSGAMVQPIDETAGSESWWDYTEPLLIGSGGIVESFGSAVSIAAGTFYVLDGGSCPNLEATAFSSDLTAVSAHLSMAKAAALTAATAEIKSDSPLGAAVSSAIPLLAGQPAQKYLVLVLYGYPDSCNGIDAPQCYADEVVQAVQAAADVGVTTIAIMLEGPSVSELNNYDWYGQALANAGNSEPVGPLDETLIPGEGCPSTSVTADYAGSPGSAQVYRVPERDPAALEAALNAAFSRIQSCQ